MSDTKTEFTEYRLTEEEYVTILDALAYCRENAIHTDARAKFNHAQSQLLQCPEFHDFSDW